MAISARLQRPIDASSLAAFRALFGLLLAFAAARYFFHGWIAEHFLAPTHFFKYWGFSWVRPWPGVGMYLHFALMVGAACCVVAGYRYRASIVVYGALFAYQHLVDKTNYLNHYYLVICCCALMACLPLNCMWSLDARRQPGLATDQLPSWVLWALRGQFAVVYVFGGLAKLNADWLLRAQPLTFWLERKGDLALLGPVLSASWSPLVLSWAGALFDLTIVPLLLLQRTRPWACVAVATFHLLTAQLFSIGMFPFFMLCGCTLFLAPNWPRTLLGRLAPAAGSGARTTSWSGPRWALPLLGLYFALQVLLPLRHWLYPGDVRWTEQGFRFSWNVMLMEKNGSVEFRVREPSTGRTFHVSPSEYFTAYQTAMMAPQPDMLLEAARIVAEDFRRRGVREPAVYADAFASLNARPPQRLVDPRVDLARETDGLSNKTWILPMQSENFDTATLVARGRQ